MIEALSPTESINISHAKLSSFAFEQRKQQEKGDFHIKFYGHVQRVKSKISDWFVKNVCLMVKCVQLTDHNLISWNVLAIIKSGASFVGEEFQENL